jgi:hypothetical protein
VALGRYEALDPCFGHEARWSRRYLSIAEVRKCLSLLIYPVVFEIWKWHSELKPTLTAGSSLGTEVQKERS